MGNVHAYRGRLAPALILAVLTALAVIVTLGLTAGPASAQSTYTTCATCHTSAKHSSNATHAGLYSSSSCTSCHANGFSAANNGVTPAACAACHGGVATILTSQQHALNACGTTPGCHGVPAATPTPTPTATIVATSVTAKLSATTIKLGKTVKTTGKVTPVATLAGKKVVALRVDFKKGAKWIKAKTATAVVTATGTYSWKYKPLKKGTFRVKASIAKTVTYLSSKTAYKTFKVK